MHPDWSLVGRESDRLLGPEATVFRMNMLPRPKTFLLLLIVLPWVLLSVLCFLELPRVVDAVASMTHPKLPLALAGVNGIPYPVRQPASHVVLLVLESGSSVDLTSFPALRRIWAESRPVSFRTARPSSDEIVTTLVTGLDLGPFVFHPLDQVLVSDEARRSLSRLPNLVTRLAQNRLSTHLHGHRLLQDLTKSPGANGAELVTSADFGDPNLASSLVALGRLPEELKSSTPGLHLLEIQLPPGPLKVTRGGFLDRLDDALTRLIAALDRRGVLIVLGTGSREGFSPFVPGLFYGGPIASGPVKVRPLDDLVPAVALCLGAPRPALTLGVPDTDLLKGLKPEDAVPILQIAVRDQSRVADHLAREFYDRRISLDVRSVDRASRLHASGDARAARRVLEDLSTGVGEALEAHRRASVTGSLDPRVPVTLCVLAVLSICCAPLVGSSFSVLIVSVMLFLSGLTVWSQVSGVPFVLDPYRVTASRLPDLYRLTTTAIVTGLVPVTVFLSVRRRGAARDFLALFLVFGGSLALYLAWFLAYNGIRAGAFNPGESPLRIAFLATAGAVAGPLLFALFGMPLAILDRLTHGTPQD